ncbi:c-type cytochrome [Phenylobacterium montanum]|uniref:c-type cytochrome n=1 Tax=Phenylobacterium montanum TaxID=2823693 RepID=UPI002012C486|nr:c-type cytochrome [Caulobacter sp. S6]
MRRVLAIATAALGIAGAAHGQGADIAKGEAAYQSRCVMCHSLDGPGQGPDLHGVVGRKAGTAADFNYSDAMTASGLTWTPDQLDKFLTDPTKIVSGSPMQAQVPDAQERRDLIAYLASLKK